MKCHLTYLCVILGFLNSCAIKGQQNKEICRPHQPGQINVSTTSSTDHVLDLTDTTQFKLVKLNSINIHRFSPEELKKEKDRIYELQLSPKHFKWKNPTSGGAVHINKYDRIEVYNCARTIDSIPKEVHIDELWRCVSGFTFGNSPSVLVTSECDIHQSESIKAVINELFEHGPQIYFIGHHD